MARELRNFAKSTIWASCQCAENAVFRNFALSAGLLSAKIVGTSLATTLTRINKGVFATKEDISAFGGTLKSDDEDVERLRNIHRNDLENIVPYYILGLLYVTTKPCPEEAKLVFATFTGARMLHSSAYFAKQQPARAIFFLVGAAVNCYLAVKVIQKFAA